MATHTHPHTNPDGVNAMLWTILAIAAIIVLAYAAYETYPPTADYTVEAPATVIEQNK